MSPRDEPVQEIQEVQTALWHCGRRMRIYSTRVQSIDGISYRIRFWECPACGQTGQTVVQVMESVFSEHRRH